MAFAVDEMYVNGRPHIADLFGLLTLVCFFSEAQLEKPFLKGWAKGTRLEFLKGHVERFRYQRQQGVTRAKDYCDNVLREWFNIYHWSMPITEEPTVNNPPTDPTAVETLNDIELELKGRVIARMYNVCVAQYTPVFYFD